MPNWVRPLNYNFLTFNKLQLLAFGDTFHRALPKYPLSGSGLSAAAGLKNGQFDRKRN
jgi:hypothetical protein